MNHSDPSSPLPGRGRIAAAMASVAVIAAALTAVAPPELAAAQASTTVAATAPATAPATATAPAGEPTAAGPDGGPQYDDGRYIVTLREEAVATYGGGVGSFAATRAKDGDDLQARSKRARAYAEHLVDTQDEVAGSVGADIISSYTLATNGFSSVLTGVQAAALAADPRVEAIVEDELLHVQQAVPSTDFLGLSGDGGVWSALGGIDAAGDGVVVGVIDTGISPENPSFAGEPLGGASGSEPYLDGDSIVFEKADGGTFRGVCEAGEQFAADDCSTKLIGARYFVDNYGEEYLGRDRGEVVSPRDGNGHGSHTASTAAGDHGVTATVLGRDFGEISGVAPAAKVAAYKVCWTGPTHWDDGCATGDLLAAIDAAVLDGVDVINYSIGGGAAMTTVSLTDQAFLRAAAAGIFVAASAGNAGPDASTADNAAPWITTVAASTIPSYEATVRLGDGRALPGGSITVPDGGLTGPLVAASALALPGATDAQLCGPDTLDPARTAGVIVLCDRGEIDRMAKSAEVARAGGIGMVLVNPTPSSIDVDAHAVPTVHLDADWHEALADYAATAGATVTLEPGNTTGTPSPATPQIAGFSSRGPILADGGDILKPDLTAPGVAILADGRNAEGEDPTFQLISGTSMSSPHVAGLAALYLGEHPQATPAEIKSALMTTAYDTVHADGSPAPDPFAQGAGHVDPTRFLDPGLLFLNDVDDWFAYIQGLDVVDLGVDAIDPSDLNLASVAVGGLAGVQDVTRTVTATEPGRYEVESVHVPGIDVTVEPSVLEFDEAGQSREFTITFRRTDAPLDEFTTGTLRWAGPGGATTVPLVVRPTVIAVPDEVIGTGRDGSVEVPVSPGDSIDVPIAVTGLARGQVFHGAVRADGAPDRHVVDLPDGATRARFDLDALDDTADLDLRLFYVDSRGGTWLMRESTSPTADEQIVVPDPGAGRFVVEVTAFSGDGAVPYDLTVYPLGGVPSAGSLTADPSVLSMRLGEPTSVSVSWSGLEPGARYFGRVQFGDTGRITDVIVTTPGDPVVEPTDLALGVEPGYVRPGKLFAAIGEGLAAGAPYSLSFDGEPVATGLAGDDGRVARQLMMPGDAAEGAHALRLESGDRSVDGVVHASALIVFEAYEIVEYGGDGGATAAAEVAFGGTGTVHFQIRGAGGSIVLDERKDVALDPMWDADAARSSAVPVAPGAYVVSATAVAADGSEHQLREKQFVVEEVAPSVLTLTPNAGDPNSMDLVYDNKVGAITQLTLRYKQCSGPLVFASLWVDTPVVSGTFDMTAFTGVDVVLDGTLIGSYANAGSERCADEPEVTNDFWAAMSDTAAVEPGPDAAKEVVADPDKPITLTMTNRYEAYSRGFDLSVGYGDDIHQGGFHFEEVPHPRVLEPGPVETRTIQVEEDAAFWVRAKYEVVKPDYQRTSHRVILTTPVTLDQLQPVVEPGEPGGPGQPGGPGEPGGPGHPGGPHQPGGDEPGDPSSPAAGGSGLAHTGVDVIAFVAIAVIVVLLGGSLLLVELRRRRRAEP